MIDTQEEREIVREKCLKTLDDYLLGDVDIDELNYCIARYCGACDEVIKERQDEVHTQSDSTNL